MTAFLQRNGCRWLNLSWQFSKTSNGRRIGVIIRFYVWRTGSMTRYPTMDMEIRSVPTDWLPLLFALRMTRLFIRSWFLPTFLLWPACVRWRRSYWRWTKTKQWLVRAMCCIWKWAKRWKNMPYTSILPMERFMLLKWTDTAISSAWMMLIFPVCWLCPTSAMWSPRIGFIRIRENICWVWTIRIFSRANMPKASVALT